MSLHRSKTVFLFSLILLLNGCCNDKLSLALDRAEALQDEYPDSALSILDSVMISSKTREDQRARYALIKTYVEANLQNLPSYDDSLINVAAEYYKGAGTASESVKAYFYKAEINYYNGNHAEAMKCALESLEWNEKVSDMRFKAKAYDLIGNIYSDAGNYPQAITYSKKAAALFKSLELRANELYAWMDVTKAYSQDDTTEQKAVELLDSLKENFKDMDSTALGVLHYRYIYPLYLLGRHNEGYRHYQKALSYWNGADLLESKPLVADMFTNIGMFDSAAYYLEKERQMNPDYDNDVNYHFALLNLADSLHDTPLYYKEVMTFSELERQNVRTAMRDEISLIERDFQRDRAQKVMITNERNKLIFIFVIAILVISALFLIVVMRQRHRQKLQEMRDYMNVTVAEMEGIKETLNKMQDTNVEIPLKTIDSFCEEYYRWNDMDDKDTIEKQREIIKGFQCALARMRDKEYMGSLQSALDRHNNDIFKHLHGLEKQLKDMDMIMLTYLIAGFSIRSVALICNTNEANVYTRWSRLGKTLEKYNGENRERFVRILDCTPTGRPKPAKN